MRKLSSTQGDFPKFLNNSSPTIYLSRQELPKMNCYIYLGAPFSYDLELKLIILRMNNKVRKSSLFHKRISFLKNPHNPIPYKRMLLSAIVIGQVSYYTPLLRLNKERTRGIQISVNTGLY
jgi:hypothetical protein